MNRKSLWFFVAALCAVLSAGLSGQGEYIVAPRDVLAVTVLDEPGLSGKFPVAPDGTISFPMVGRVQVAQSTLKSIESELRTRLGKGFVQNPQVSVLVDFMSQHITVAGEVRQAGSIPISGATTLLEALVRAGSVTENAGSEAVIIRGGSEGSAGRNFEGAAAESVRVDISAFQRGDMSRNVTLRDGDTVFVPRAEMIQVFVFGSVRSPGSYTLRKNATVIQALALAGGVAERGAPNRITVLRTVGGKNREVKATLNDPIQAGDTLVVPRRRF